MEKLYEKSIEKLLDISAWNLHGAASWENNYSLKPFVVDKIFSKKSDIICLTEVVFAEGFDYLLKTAHNQGYVNFHNLQSAANGILPSLTLVTNKKALNPLVIRVSEPFYM